MNNFYPFPKLSPAAELYEHRVNGVFSRLEIEKCGQRYPVTEQEGDLLLALDGDCSPRALGLSSRDVEAWMDKGVLTRGSRVRWHGLYAMISLLPLDHLRDSTLARRITLFLFFCGFPALLLCPALFLHLLQERMMLLSFSWYDEVGGYFFFALSILAHEMAHALAAVAVNPKGRCHEMGMLVPIPAFYVTFMSPDESPFMQFVVSSVGIHANWLFALLFLLLAVPATPFCDALMLGAWLSYLTGLLNLIPGGIPGVSYDGTRMLEALLHPELGCPLHLRAVRFLLDAEYRHEVFTSGCAARLLIGYGLALAGFAANLALFVFSLWFNIWLYILH